MLGMFIETKHSWTQKKQMKIGVFLTSGLGLVRILSFHIYVFLLPVMQERQVM